MLSQDQEETNHGSEGVECEEDSSTGSALEKKRRVRACDMCRRRKVRCDGGRVPGKQCSNCNAFKYTCKYTQTSKKRFTDPEYVQNLETQLARTQDLLQKLSSRLEVLDPQGTSTADRDHATPSGVQSPASDHEQAPIVTTRSPAVRLPNMTSKFDQNDDELDPSDDEMMLRYNLEKNVKHLKQLSLKADLPHFLGKSSGLIFLQKALDMKEEYISDKPKGALQMPLAGARPEFWNDLPWVTQPEIPYPIQAFPEPGLMASLIDLYFTNYNIYMPLLHRPTFEKNIREGLHLVDEGFGAVLLLTCALAANFSDDPRVLLDGVNNTHSAGWKWFHHVQRSRKAFRITPPCLYDLQIACLVGEFLHHSAVAQSSFSVIGNGIRIAQDLGAHRRKVYATPPTAEGELLKRAFWILVALDRALSSALGRACCIQDEDFDVDPLIECDDEYWYNDDGQAVFEQPPGKPSLIAFFNSLIRLNQIHGCVLRTIYAINKSKSLLGFSGPDWEQHIVTELDSALNRWVDTVPHHLKWDPHMENPIHLNQSAFLYTAYYSLQIIIHRPYIPSPRKSSPLSFPSLAICTNAARSCIHVLDVQYNRSRASTHQNMMGLFCSAVVLMLNIWGGKRAGTAVSVPRELADVHKVMIMLKALEPRWHTAGKVLDVLCELATAGALPLPQLNANLKRSRETPSAESSASSSISSPQSVSLDGGSTTAVPKRLHLQKPALEPVAAFPAQRGIPDMLPTSFDFSDVSLPMHSDELGRFPLHPAFSSQPGPSILSTSGGWCSPGANPQCTSAARADAGAVSGDRCMDLDSIFSLSQQAPTAGTPYAPADFVGYTPPAEHQSPPDDVGQTSSQGVWGAFPNTLDSDTAAMWSTAPTSMEWDDWGRYILSMNSMGGVTGSPDSPQPTF